MTVPPEVEVEIRRLFFAEHWPVGTIARQLNVHDDVVRRVTGLLSPRRVLPEQPRIVAPYEAFIAEQLERYPTLLATRIYDMVRDRGYTGSVRTIREHVAKVRPRKKSEAFLRMDPLIGEQSQIDWAHIGKIDVEGGTRTLWLFLIVLSWSRGMWGELVLDLGAATFARSLYRAAAYFGGTTRQWLFDNPKTVVVERRGDAVRFHGTLLDIASHHHVELRLCAVRKANQKGRVERAIRFVRDRFLAGRRITSVEQGNRELLVFFEQIAHARQHPTIPSRTVSDCLNEEKSRLLALPSTPYSCDLVLPVAVDKTAFIRFDTNSYSVPSEHASRTLTLAAGDRVVRILDGSLEIARHPRSYGRRRVIECPAHREALVAEKRGAREQKGRDRLTAVAPSIGALYQRWLDHGRNLGNMTAQAVRLLDLYGDDVFRVAVDDLIARGAHDPGALAMLCERLRKKDSPVVTEPRFADHVEDRDVIPHDLEAYDARRRR